jgi:hypothetical protein
MRTSSHPRISRSAAVVVAAAAIVGPAAAAHGASQPTAPSATAMVHLSDALWSDCQYTGAEHDCLATDVFGSNVTETLGTRTKATHEVDLTVYLVHFHADGSFDVDPNLVATGVGRDATVHITTTDTWIVATSVALSDGTRAHIGISMTGVGDPVFKDHGTSFSDSLCASGNAVGTSHFERRNADTTGSVVVHGTAEGLVPSFVSQAATYVEHDRGVCA